MAGTEGAAAPAATGAPADTSSSSEAPETTTEETQGTETEETEETEQPEGGEGGGREEEAAEGGEIAGETEEEGEEGSEASPAKPKEATSAEDAREVDVDGEKITIGELKESHRYLPQAIEAYKKAKAIHEGAQRLVGSFVENTGPALIDAFAAKLFKGDRERAYAHVIKVCSAIVNEHIEYSELPESEREVLRWQRKAQEAEEEAKRIKEETEAAAAKTQAEENTRAWGIRITQALKTAGMPTDAETVDDVANVILEGRKAGREIPPARAVEILKRDQAKRQSRDWEKLNPDDVPDTFFQKLQEHRMKKVRGAPPAARVVKTPERKPPSKPGKSYDESLSPLV